MKKSIRGKLFCLWLLLFFLSVPAIGGDNKPETTLAGIGEEPPSLELLDFLGGWETDENKWVDPVEFDSATEPERDDEPDEE